jgi:hypothetical protein
VVRCSIVTAPGKRSTLTAFASPMRSLKQEADAASAVYLWCVAACNMDVLIALP